MGSQMSLHRYHSPVTAPKPPSRHAQAVESRSGLRLLHISGQLGLDSNGKLATSDLGQHEQVWDNIRHLLAAANMTFVDLVKVCAYVTDRSQITHYRNVRDRVLNGVEVASTAVVVAALGNPDWVVEIDAVAAAQ